MVAIFRMNQIQTIPTHQFIRSIAEDLNRGHTAVQDLPFGLMTETASDPCSIRDRKPWKDVAIAHPFLAARKDLVKHFKPRNKFPSKCLYATPPGWNPSGLPRVR